MESYVNLIVLDVLVTVGCLLILLRHGRISATHPAASYFFFHVYTVTTRLWAIANGAPTLFSWGFPFEPVRQDEIIRAALLMDAALVIMTIAWILASRHDLRKSGALPQPDQLPPGNLSKRYIWLVVAFALPIGFVAMFFFTTIPGVTVTADLGAWRQSSWLAILPGWFGLSLLALIYWYGLRRPLMLPMVAFLALMAYQGYGRFRVLIPIILLAQIYLDRKNRRWPTVSVVIALVIVALLFFPLKSIGRGFQQGRAVSDIAALSGEIISDALVAQAGDQTFLDMFASALTLADLKGELLLGKPYLSLLTLPIPRPLWPDKPGLANYLFDISTSWRPMAQTGMIVTYLGEAYLNFWYAGIFGMPFLLAYVLARMYFRAYRSNYYSVVHFAYLLIAANLLQVYRDGLISLVVFLFVNMMPLMAIIALHLIRPVQGRSSKRHRRRVHGLPALAPAWTSNTPAPPGATTKLGASSLPVADQTLTPSSTPAARPQ